MKVTRKLLSLQPPTLEDAGEFLEFVRESRAHHRPWVTPPSKPGLFQAYVERGRRDDFKSFLVRRTQDREIVGVFNVSQIFRGGFQNACLGYYGSARLAGRGYMSVALAEVLRVVFRSLRLHRLEANIQPGNRDSIALVKRCGFRREGYSPRYLKVGGRWRDHERWAITRENWRSRPPR